MALSLIGNEAAYYTTVFGTVEFTEVEGGCWY